MELYSKVTTIFQIWKNNFRFYSNEKMMRSIKKSKLDRKVEGDVIKYICREFYNASSEIIKIGSIKLKQLN